MYIIVNTYIVRQKNNFSAFEQNSNRLSILINFRKHFFWEFIGNINKFGQLFLKKQRLQQQKPYIGLHKHVDLVSQIR
jgi:hypothetical protein